MKNQDKLWLKSTFSTTIVMFIIIGAGLAGLSGLSLYRFIINKTVDSIILAIVLIVVAAFFIILVFISRHNGIYFNAVDKTIEVKKLFRRTKIPLAKIRSYSLTLYPEIKEGREVIEIGYLDLLLNSPVDNKTKYEFSFVYKNHDYFIKNKARIDNFMSTYAFDCINVTSAFEEIFMEIVHVDNDEYYEIVKSGSFVYFDYEYLTSQKVGTQIKVINISSSDFVITTAKDTVFFYGDEEGHDEIITNLRSEYPSIYINEEKKPHDGEVVEALILIINDRL